MKRALPLFLLAGCPAPLPCAADAPAATRLEVAGVACDPCTVDFGTVAVALQESRRVDIHTSCAGNDTASGEASIDETGAFSVNDFQHLPFAPGAVGFIFVHFTPASAGVQAGGLSISLNDGNTLHAALTGTGQ